MVYEDTIAAIGSGLTASGIGIVRVSGADAVSIADTVFRPIGRPLALSRPYTIHYGHICDGEEVVDEVLAMLMKAPHSYTGEDVVEIQCHGGPFVMQKILSTVLTAGARLAEPGEFSKRAFLNGRIDLSQAEATMGLIQSQNEFARKAAIAGLTGKFSAKIRSIRDRLLTETAYLEAALDDPEHISLDGYGERLEKTAGECLADIYRLIEQSDKGRVVADGIRTVIIGRPNVGKSSLLNMLLGEERAIVTEIAGTTRDTLEETMRLGDISLRLVDTAGIRESDDAIERIGVMKAEEKAALADLILYVVDGSEEYTEDEEKIRKLLEGQKAIVIINKSDLPQKADKAEIEEKTGLSAVVISATEETGREELEERIRELFLTGQIAGGSDMMLANQRQKQSLAKAGESLKMVINAINEGMPEDLYTVDLMDAYTELGKITGESVEDDLADKIFSDFCMGK